METAVIGVFLAAYWVLGDLFAPEMCYTQIREEPVVWRWVECDSIDLTVVEDQN